MVDSKKSTTAKKFCVLIQIYLMLKKRYKRQCLNVQAKSVITSLMVVLSK